MNKRMKFFLYSAVLIGSGYFAWNRYHYFFDTTLPEVRLMGINDNGYYGGEISCQALGSDGYKVAKLSIWLDDNPFIKNVSINSRSFEYPFLLPTTSLSQGKHVLKLEVINGTYAAKKSMIEKPFFIDNEPLRATFAKQDVNFKVLQGRTLHVKVHVNKKIKEAQIMVLNVTYPCFSEAQQSLMYECFVPISCEQEPNTHDLVAHITDLVGNKVQLDTTVEVVQGQFKRQQLHVSTEKVSMEKKLGSDNDVLEQQLEHLVKQSPEEKLWQGAFYCPTEIQKISTEFGSIRVTPERGLYQHKAVDILNTPKSVVWAPQDGIVVVKDRYALSGNTVVIDHGHGIFSLFFHLDTFADTIQTGMKIKRGNPLGTLGMTGYATGYHLHWEMRVANMKVDPMQWTMQTF